MTTPDTEAMNKPDPRTAMEAAIGKLWERWTETIWDKWCYNKDQESAAFTAGYEAALSQTSDLTAKLAIAKKALEHYADRATWRGLPQMREYTFAQHGHKVADEALAEIGETKVSRGKV